MVVTIIQNIKQYRINAENIYEKPELLRLHFNDISKKLIWEKELNFYIDEQGNPISKHKTILLPLFQYI